MTTYESLIKLLNDEHFHPATETNNGTITALHVQAFPERADEICERLKKILENEMVSIKKFPNQNYIEIKFKK